MGVHLCDRRLQPRQNAEPGLHAGSSRLTPGRSVSKRRTTGIWRRLLTEILETPAAKGLHGATQERNTRCQTSFFRIMLVLLCYKQNQIRIELVGGQTLFARPTGKALCGIYGWPGASRGAR